MPERLGPFRVTELLEAAKHFGTPLFAYDVGTVEANYRSLRAAIPERVAIHYALKANGSAALLQILRRCGANVDVASPGELHLARLLGFASDEVVYTAAGRSDSEIEFALDPAVGLLVIEALDEAEALSRLAQERGLVQDILLRVRLPVVEDADGMLIVQKRSKFGVRPEELLHVVTRLQLLPGIRLRGLHANQHTACLDERVHERVYHSLMDEALGLLARSVAIDTVDFGGGLGVSYGQEPGLDLQMIGRALTRQVERAPRGWRFLIEPGRFLVANAGAYVFRVLSAKREASRQVLVTEGGIHQLFRLGLRDKNKLLQVLSPAGHELIASSVWGPLLSSDDELVSDMPLPELERGALLAIPNCGAYAFSHSLSRFCYYPTPVELLRCHESWHCVRERGCSDDVVQGQHWHQQDRPLAFGTSGRSKS